MDSFANNNAEYLILFCRRLPDVGAKPKVDNICVFTFNRIESGADKAESVVKCMCLLQILTRK
jgi:hypothetical protein